MKTTTNKKVTHLTAVRTIIIKAIAAKKSKSVKLEDLAQDIFHTDLPKLVRKMKREKLLSYVWNEDGSRTVGVTTIALNLLKAA